MTLIWIVLTLIWIVLTLIIFGVLICVFYFTSDSFEVSIVEGMLFFDVGGLLMLFFDVGQVFFDDIGLEGG